MKLAVSGADVAGEAGDSGATVRKRDEWTVRHILVVVELKMQGHGCGSFSTDEDEPSRACVVTEGYTHGPVAQVVMYNLAHVLRGRAALGHPLPENIPSAVILGL
jgi:hypothetical protein